MNKQEKCKCNAKYENATKAAKATNRQIKCEFAESRREVETTVKWLQTEYIHLSSMRRIQYLNGNEPTKFENK